MSTMFKMPLPVLILTLSAFAIGTAEFVIAGILTQVSESLNITNGQAGNLITIYALSIVIGGPILTLWLINYDKKKVLIGLMILFVISNLVSAYTENYDMLLISRLFAGLTQGPFYGIGAVVATKLVSKNMEGQAIGQMFAGLTLANVLGVPAGTWIGNIWGWNVTFFVVSILGLISLIAIILLIPSLKVEKKVSLTSQISAFADRNLISSLIITVLAWTGFMTFYGYIAPIAEEVVGFSRTDLTWILILMGIGLVIGNNMGGKAADKNLSKALIFWPLAMIIVLLIISIVSPFKWLFLIFAFLFGIVSFANVPPLQMRVMKYGNKAPELAATANISAFNIANALGGVIGALVIDSFLGASWIAICAIIIPIIGVLFILFEEKRIKSN